MTLSAQDSTKSVKNPDQLNFVLKNDETCYGGALVGLDLVYKQLCNYVDQGTYWPLGQMGSTEEGDLSSGNPIATGIVLDNVQRGPATVTGVDYLKDLLKPVYATDENTYTLSQATGDAPAVGWVCKTYPTSYSTLATTKADVMLFSMEHFIERYLALNTLPNRRELNFKFPLPPAATQAVTTDLWWDLLGTSAAAAVLAGGGFQVTTNTTNYGSIAPAAAALATGDFYATRNPEMIAKVVTASAGAHFIGFTLSAVGDLTTDDDYYVFYKEDGGTTWYCAWGKGGVDATPTSTGVAVSTTAYHDFQVMIADDGYVYFFIDTEYVGISDAAATTNAAFWPSVAGKHSSATTFNVREITVRNNHSA